MAAHESQRLSYTGILGFTLDPLTRSRSLRRPHNAEEKVSLIAPHGAKSSLIPSGFWQVSFSVNSVVLTKRRPFRPAFLFIPTLFSAFVRVRVGVPRMLNLWPRVVIPSGSTLYTRGIPHNALSSNCWSSRARGICFSSLSNLKSAIPSQLHSRLSRRRYPTPNAIPHL